MKKVYFIAMLLMMSSAIFGQETILLSEDFNDHPITVTNKSVADWAPEGWDNWNLDGLYTYAGRVFGAYRTYQSTWLPRYDFDGKKFMVSVSYLTDPDVKADDWLVTSAIELPSGKDNVVNFSVKSFGADSFRDGIQVYAIKSSVYESLKETTPTEELSAAFVNAATLIHSEASVPNTEWTARWTSLNSLNGESVRIMFRNNSPRCDYLGLDDISVVSTDNAPTLLLSEDFEDHPITVTNKSVADWAPEGWDNWNLDGLYTYAGRVFGAYRTYKSTWLPRYDFDEKKFMVSVSYLTDPDVKADDWLVTSAIELPSGKDNIVHFSVKSFGADSFRDGIQVYAIKNSVYESLKETTPTEELSDAFVNAATLIHSEESVPNTEWTARWASLNSLNGESVRIMFRNNSPRGDYLGLDDISIVSSGAAPTLPDPINLAATQVKKDVKLTWEAPGEAPDTYEILRDGERIGTSATTSYTDEGIGVADATVEYCVKCVYEQGTSKGICKEFNVIEYILNPANELSLVQEYNDVKLSWRAPQAGVGTFLSYRILRNEELLADELKALTYTDTGIGATVATLKYCVEAVYDDGVSEGACKTIDVKPYVFPKLETIEIRQAKNNVILSWEKPDPLAGNYQLLRNGEVIVETLSYRTYEDVDIVTTATTIEYCIRTKYYYPVEGISDATCVTIQVEPVKNPSEFFTSFEGNKIPDGWNNRRPYTWKSAPVNWNIFSGNIPFDEEFYWWDGHHYAANNEGAIETEQVLITEGKTDFSFDLALRRTSLNATAPGIECYVDISKDNGETWTPITGNVAEKISGWPANDGDATIFIDLADHIGQDVKLAVRGIAKANYTVLALDNVRLGAPPAEPDYRVTAQNEYYTQVPLAHATVNLAGAQLYNKGAAKQGGLLRVDAGTYSQTCEIPAIERETSKIVTTTVPFTATETGTVTVTYSIDGQASTEHNTSSTTFLVTDNTFAVDDGTYKGNLGSNQGPLSIGHQFAFTKDLSAVTAFEIAFGDYTVPEFSLSIFSIGADLQLKEIYTSEIMQKRGTAKEFSEYEIAVQDLKKGDYLFTLNQLTEYNIGLAYDKSGKVSKWNNGGKLAEQGGFGAVALRIKTAESSPLRPAEDLTGKDTGDDIELSWTPGSNAPATFTINRNGVEIATGLTANSFTDTGMGAIRDTYEYCVVAVYEDGDSRPVCISVKTVAHPAVGDLEGKIVENDIHLSWTSEYVTTEVPDSEYLFFEGFNNGIPYTWKNVDADGDTYKWIAFVDVNGDSGDSYEGSGFVASESATQIEGYGAYPLTPDNWLISPAIQLTRDNKLTYVVKAQSETAHEEKYSILISTTDASNAASFTRIHTETLIKPDWIKKEIDLSDYAGKKIYIAFQHYDCTNQLQIHLDAVGVTSGTPLPGVTFTIMRNDRVLASELEALSFVDEDRGLVEGTHHYCIQAVYDDGESLAECVDVPVIIIGIPAVAEDKPSVYPTLTNGNITVKTTSRSTIKLMDISGRILNEYESEGTLSINLNYPAGVYLVVIDSGERIHTQKVILKR